MKEIRNILICGLGAIGCVCACHIYEKKEYNLKILVDESRLKRYIENPTIFNSKEYRFDYVLPSETGFKADLIIIATKNDAFDFVVDSIKNFVTKETIFMSLLNGVQSEQKLASVYGSDNLLISFYIGASCVREGRNIKQDKGEYCIETGPYDNSKPQAAEAVSHFFDNAGIKYICSLNIKEEYWKKFIINTGINQLSAVSGKTLKEIKQNPELVKRLKALMYEAALTAKVSGITHYKEIYDSAVKFLMEEIEDATPSMLQDIKSERKTEVDIFSGYIIQICSKNNIKTLENEKIHNEIKQIELKFDKNMV